MIQVGEVCSEVMTYLDEGSEPSEFDNLTPAELSAIFSGQESHHLETLKHVSPKQIYKLFLKFQER